MTRGLLRTDVSESDCADRAEKLYVTELELFKARKTALAAAFAPVGVYTLRPGQNGGADPNATSPWTITPDGKGVIHKSCDCIGCALWARGLDRYQPTRFAHLYGGYINTDSLLMDALGVRAVTGVGSDEPARKLFSPASSLRRGTWVVFPSRYVNGRRVATTWGHIMTIVNVVGGDGPLPTKLLDVVDKIAVVHCHGGNRTPMAIARESLRDAIGSAVNRAHLIELNANV